MVMWGFFLFHNSEFRTYPAQTEWIWSLCALFFSGIGISNYHHSKKHAHLLFLAKTLSNLSQFYYLWEKKSDT